MVLIRRTGWRVACAATHPREWAFAAGRTGRRLEAVTVFSPPVEGSTLMKRKIVLGGACIVGVIVLALVALPFLISVDRFRPQIQDKLTDALGRPVSIGHLSLSILGGDLSAENISIGDDPAFSKFSIHPGEVAGSGSRDDAPDLLARHSHPVHQPARARRGLAAIQFGQMEFLLSGRQWKEEPSPPRVLQPAAAQT